MGVEKRQHPRIPINVSVECRGKSIFQKTQCYNLSKGGMFIATDKLEEPGTRIEVIFEIGDEHKRAIQAEAVVRWNRNAAGKADDGTFLPAGMGIQFIKVFPFNGIRILEKIINERRERE